MAPPRRSSRVRNISQRERHPKHPGKDIISSLFPEVQTLIMIECDWNTLLQLRAASTGWHNRVHEHLVSPAKSIRNTIWYNAAAAADPDSPAGDPGYIFELDAIGRIFPGGDYYAWQAKYWEENDVAVHRIFLDRRAAMKSATFTPGDVGSDPLLCPIVEGPIPILLCYEVDGDTNIAKFVVWPETKGGVVTVGEFCGRLKGVWDSMMRWEERLKITGMSCTASSAGYLTINITVICISSARERADYIDPMAYRNPYDWLDDTTDGSDGESYQLIFTDDEESDDESDEDGYEAAEWFEDSASGSYGDPMAAYSSTQLLGMPAGDEISPWVLVNASGWEGEVKEKEGMALI